MPSTRVTLCLSCQLCSHYRCLQIAVSNRSAFITGTWNTNTELGVGKMGSEMDLQQNLNNVNTHRKGQDLRKYITFHQCSSLGSGIIGISVLLLKQPTFLK